jgi:hypothetical protein
MTSQLTEVIVDCHDLELEATFWCAVLGYERAHSGDGWLAIAPPGMLPGAESRTPAIAFVLVPEDKVVKNRVHLDVTPVDESQLDEVQRLIGLGARRTDIGQRDTSWVVMIDPEGNEFCVMRAGSDQPNG